jgi:hypothetical protein
LEFDEGDDFVGDHFLLAELLALHLRRHQQVDQAILGVLAQNSLTSLGVLPAKIPICFEIDREVMDGALASLAPTEAARPQVVRIADTVNVERFLASEACVQELTGTRACTRWAARGIWSLIRLEIWVELEL